MKTILAAPYLRIDRIVPRAGLIAVHASSLQRGVNCPSCGILARRVHSWYQRVFADLPWAGVAVRLSLTVRRYFCDVPACPRKVFCERLPELAAPYARKTRRLADLLQVIALIAGGEAAARIISAVGLEVSPDTLLRLSRSASPPPSTGLSVIGVDDFATRRGQRYGTIIVDHEQHRIVDLLPDREAATLTAWLRAHPGITVITRDRAPAYADGARQGAPAALHVADRWHLLHNLTEAVERFLQTKHAELKRIAKTILPTTEPAVAPVADSPRTRLTQWNERRQSRWQEVHRLAAQGLPIRQIGIELKMHRRTVRLLLRSDSCPERHIPSSRRTILDPWQEHLQRRWEEGCHSAAELWREIKEAGFKGSQSMVRHFVARWRAVSASGAKPSTAAGRPGRFVASARNCVWWLLKTDEELRPEQLKFVGSLCTDNPEIAELRTLAQSFSEIVRTHDSEGFRQWISKASHSVSREVAGFASGLTRDLAAVEAAIASRWSNGPTEGHVNRLKTIKRSTYGRAKLDLLKARLLCSP